MDIWEIIILRPMINVLIVGSKYLFNSPGLAIIVFTILIRVVMYPLTKKQLLSSKKMQDMQPKIQELQKKYGKDKQRMAKEQAALLKESGVTNIGCILPMLIQMPIWIALYQSITRILATGPEELLNLSRYLYPSWHIVFPMVPLNSHFFWLNLGSPDRCILCPILVVGTMWIQQKMVTPDQHRPPASSAESDDADNDAGYVCFHDIIIPQRTGAVLGCFEYHQYRHAIFYHRLGRTGTCSVRNLT